MDCKKLVTHLQQLIYLKGFQDGLNRATEIFEKHLTAFREEDVKIILDEAVEKVIKQSGGK